MNTKSQWEDLKQRDLLRNFVLGVKKIGQMGMDWIYLAYNRVWLDPFNTVHSGFIKMCRIS
jgi:hypothetical protein